MRVALFNAISTGIVSLIMIYFVSIQHEKKCADAYFKPWLYCEIMLCIMTIPLFYMEFLETKNKH